MEANKSTAGIALIKPEFLDLNHKRKLAEYLPADVEKEMSQSTQPAVDTDEPPSKKKKFKGRNKNRPIEKRLHASGKLCPAIVAEKECKFGEKCRFLHNIDQYLNTKLPDLGSQCHIYKNFGKCQYGLACRFAGIHIDENKKNVINEPLLNETSQKGPTSLNVLEKDLQVKLWKKKYDFSPADNLVFKVTGKGNLYEKNRQQRLQEQSEKNGETATQQASTADAENKIGPVTDEDQIKLRPAEKKKIDFKDKLYLAPLTTVGNLPFRRICKRHGADITCGEMAVATNLLQGQQSEWALLKRHHTEDLYGIQICGGYPDTLTRVAQLLTENCKVDFIDINCGCPIDLIFHKGEGCGMMGHINRLENVAQCMTQIMDIPLTIKMRTGILDDKNIAHNIITRLYDLNVSMVTIHGRSRQQRYTKLADWEYIDRCAKLAAPMPVFGNGDILSYEDYNMCRSKTAVAGTMIARGALIKPWLFTEIKEQRHWDISATERLDLLRDYTNYGLEHWGSDTQGVETTRRFMLEWLSFLYRYIPVGLLERVPQRINEKPPFYFGRNDLETMMASPNCADWVKISEMLLGPVPEGFIFLPKHKASAYM